MNRFILSLVALSTFTACTGFSGQEAHMVFDAANAVGFSAYRTLAAESEEAGARDTGTFTFTGGESSFTFEGEVVGDSDWTGTVGVNGEMSWAEAEWHFTYGLGYEQVSAEDMLIDGDMSWSLDVEGTGPMEGVIVYSVLGEITAQGAATGTGPVDYTVTVEAGSNTLSFDAQGEVDGTTIDSSWTLTVVGF
ncbi:MAG: hypothetical protein IPI35_24355 [Deltaproteobacteria bacterium]|nr:hypothetical protein [Deltaproteobacteria bacterium]